MLTDDELAYMRQTQDDARPTAATVASREETPDGMGGQTTALGDPVPVTIRVDDRARKVPDAILAKHGGNVVTITMDLVPVQNGDRITVSPTQAYEIVGRGDPDEWATAQQVYAVRGSWSE